MSADELRLLKFCSQITSQTQDGKLAETTTCVCLAKTQQDKCPARRLSRKPEWFKIFTCPIIWSLIAVRISYRWASDLRTMLPTFMSNIVHLEPSVIGQLLSLQTASGAILGTILLYVLRKYSNRSPFGWSLTNHRRLTQSIAQSCNIGFSLSLIVFDCHIAPFVCQIFYSPIIATFFALGYRQIPLDMSPVDSGLLLSTIHMSSFLEMFALPLSAKILSLTTKNPSLVTGDRSAWRNVWASSVTLSTISLTLFLCFSRSEPNSYSHLESAGSCKSRINSADIQDER